MNLTELIKDAERMLFILQPNGKDFCHGMNQSEGVLKYCRKTDYSTDIKCKYFDVNTRGYDLSYCRWKR